MRRWIVFGIVSNGVFYASLCFCDYHLSPLERGRLRSSANIERDGSEIWTGEFRDLRRWIRFFPARGERRYNRLAWIKGLFRRSRALFEDMCIAMSLYSLWDICIRGIVCFGFSIEFELLMGKSRRWRGYLYSSNLCQCQHQTFLLFGTPTLCQGAWNLL